MPNVNSGLALFSGVYQTAPQAVAYSINQNTIAALSNIGTTETAFSLNVNLIAGGTLPPAVLTIEPGLWAGGRPFKVRAVGTVTTAASSTVAFKLYQVPYAILIAGTAGTLGNDTLVATYSTSNAIATTTASFYLEGTFQWEPVVGKLIGQFNGFVGGGGNATVVTSPTATTTATLTPPVTSIPAADGSLNLNFILSATFGTGNAGNTVNLNWFEWEGV